MSSPKLVEDKVVESSNSSHVLVSPDETLESASAKISSIVLERKHPPFWWVSFAIAFALLMGLLYGITILFAIGVGIWGIDIPVAWGFAIVNFVWWIGIGHAGTFISAILLLLLQKWRNSINRLAEAMTLFAVACAGLFPLLHLGRPWTFFWILPYPNTMGLWPQFRSPLVWDVFAVCTYFTVSLIFWYIGLIPDLATMRDRARTRLSKVGFGIISLGWRGSAIHWKHFQTVYLILAGLSTPLVLSVHSVVSTDFAVANIPGWHTTIFPPFFVAGAIYSGFAMVLNIMIPLRYVYRLESVITERHLNCMAGVMFATGLMVGYGYIMETFTGWYSGDIYEQYLVINRAIGPYGWTYWLLLLVNIVIPQALWFRRIRSNPVSLFCVALSVNVGMWLERFVIIIVSLHRDFLTSSWGIYAPTGWDWLILFGSVGLFVSLVFLFVRFLPMIPMSEIKEIVAEREEEAA
ncbi:MAG: polysulfide reductase NrfD [Verrucomicrobia bacterium]|nr:polysulfide reductase NrfD [Verrucomicrobiota bacterium]MBV8485781.1 polysulfide reductase NrfD [Verrucomicrobiota bacterium]